MKYYLVTDLVVILYTNYKEMHKMQNYLNIQGSNYEIGRKAGRFWGDYFQKYSKTLKEGNQGKNLVNRYLNKWIKDDWSHDFAPLLENTMKYFPDIMDEIAGMAKGVTDSGLRTSLTSVFALCLGETGDEGCHCSSIVARTDNGYVMGTNDEDYSDVDPLLFAKVSLRTGTSNKEFVSISYPFQLFGSAAGMNRYIAFQGNSIGFPDKVYQQIKDSWACRIPKTVLSRKMLEKNNMRAIQHLLESCHTTLPNHHYIMSHDKAFSVDVVPRLETICYDGNVVKIIEIEDKHFHTNHFLKATGSTRKTYLKDWKWADKRDRADSEERYEKLKEELATKELLDYESIKEILQSMAAEKKYKGHTSGSLFFKISKRAALCESFFYFGKNNHIEESL